MEDYDQWLSASASPEEMDSVALPSGYRIIGHLDDVTDPKSALREVIGESLLIFLGAQVDEPIH